MYRRRSVPVPAWRYIDPNKRDNLPQWVVDLINNWPNPPGVIFSDRGPIIVRNIGDNYLLNCKVGDWLVREDDRIFVYDDQEFKTLYEPLPIGMADEQNKELSTR